MTYRGCHRLHTLGIQAVFIQHGKQRAPFVAMQSSESADVGPSTKEAAAGFDFHQRTWKRGGGGGIGRKGNKRVRGMRERGKDEVWGNEAITIS